MRKNGFTLIELLVVIAIISLIATIGIVALQSARAAARDTKRIADLTQIAKALELYYDDNDSYPIAANLCYGEYNFYSGATTDGGGCNANNEWEALGTILGIQIDDDPLKGVTAYYPYDYNNEYGYIYAVESDGSAYELITKLETNHDERCELKGYTILTDSFGSSGYTNLGKGASLCANASNQKYYLYSYAH